MGYKNIFLHLIIGDVAVDSKLALGVIVLAVIVLALTYVVSSDVFASGSNVAVQMTDPPSVPSGTQQLLISYSSVQVHTESIGNLSGNQSGWVTASGSGTVNLVALTNVSQTIANAHVTANAVINVVRFNITSAKIVINGTTYNVSSPNSQITVAVTGSGKINSNASSVLIDFYPTVTARGGATAGSYMLVPAARAVVVNGNATVSINTNIGSTAAISGSVKAKLGLGIGIGGSGSGNTTTSANSTVEVRAGQRVSNFMAESVNYSSGTVSGLLYIEYPVARNVGTNTTLHVNSTIGYACDNTQFKLESIYSNSTALFVHINNTATIGGCPI